jgi:hypothetical protein
MNQVSLLILKVLWIGLSLRIDSKIVKDQKLKIIFYKCYNIIVKRAKSPKAKSEMPKKKKKKTRAKTMQPKYHLTK